MLRPRSFVATVLALALVPVPGLASVVAQPAEAPAPADETADGGAVPVEGDEIPSEVRADGDEEIPTEVESEPEPEPEPEPEVAETLAPEGPERPPEPTLAHGKFKAKGTGLLISGGVLLGLGVAGVLTSFFLTRCPDTELNKSFACRNRQHNTFAVPATGTVALLGAVLLAVGLTYRVRYKRWETWDPTRAKTAFRPTITADGVSFQF